jgi:hypothetical protein
MQAPSEEQMAKCFFEKKLTLEIMAILSFQKLF